jgi:hypothetical protein
MILLNVASGITDLDDDVMTNVPQAESVAEATEIWGSEDNLLHALNAKLKQDATQGPKQPLRDALADHGEGSDEWAAALVTYREATEAYRPTGRKGGSRPGGITRKQETQAMDRLAAQDPEKYAEIMAGLLD